MPKIGYKQRMTQITMIAITLCSLQGCLDAAMTGAQVAYNHDHIKKSFTDQYITTQAYRRVYKDTHKYDDSNISIATFQQNVLIAGQITKPEQKQEVGELIKSIPNTKHVYNLVQVSSPSTPLTRISDSWITAKVKTKLIALEDLDPNQIKVVTENGTVFLMGTILVDQVDAVVNVARTTDGVQNVVKIFTLLRISNA